MGNTLSDEVRARLTRAVEHSSLAAVAAALGIPRPTLRHILVDGAEPRRGTIRLIAEALDRIDAGSDQHEAAP